MVLVLAWAVYRLFGEFIRLRERVQRQDRRLNEVLYKATRRNAKPE